MKTIKLLIVFLISIVVYSLNFAGVTYAHPWRTDSSGCHTCKTNCAKQGLRYGEYHCHGKKR